MLSARSQLMRNATLTAAQVVVTAASMFVVYRYLLDRLGAARLGTWSIVMAASSIARITDMGFAGGLTRYVAKYRGMHDDAAVVEIIDTGVVSLVAATALVLALAFPAITHIVPRLIPEAAQDALLLLPYALSSLAVLTVASAYLSSIDGLLRTDLRNLIVMSGTLLYLLLVLAFVDQWGFIGLGWAQLCQSVAIFLAAVVVLHRQVSLSWLPLRWSRERFNEMIGYNAHLQLGSLASLLGDPAAKIMLGRFGDLATVGYFEMATKMVSQFRAIVVNVNQVLVPFIAQFKDDQKDAVATLYERTHAQILFISTCFFGLLMACIPVVSMIWLGEYNTTFIFVCLTMLPAIALNTLASAAFFSNLGTGEAASNAVVQVCMGLVNISLGWWLGLSFGGAGVIAAFALSIAGGSFFLVLRFRWLHGLPVSTMIPPGQRLHAVTTWAAAATSICLNLALQRNHINIWWSVFGVAVATIVAISLSNKMIRRTWAQVMAKQRIR